MQLTCWLLNLIALAIARQEILDPIDHFKLVLYSNAAGGDTSNAMKGWGACNLETGEYARGLWPLIVIDNRKHMGEKWGSKLSVLEGFGGAADLSIWAEEVARRRGCWFNV